MGVLALFAVLLVLIGVFARPGSDGINRLKGHPILTVLSGSMRPVFSPGDMIIDNPVTLSQAKRLAIGNVITFHVANQGSKGLITHRIVAVHNVDGVISYQTKGDANNTADLEPVSPQQIVGTYRNHIPFGGYVLQGAQNKSIFFIVIAVPLVYLVVIGIAKNWNEPTKPDDVDSTRSLAAAADRSAPVMASALVQPRSPDESAAHGSVGNQPGAVPSTSGYPEGGSVLS